MQSRGVTRTHKKAQSELRKAQKNIRRCARGIDQCLDGIFEALTLAKKDKDAQKLIQICKFLREFKESSRSQEKESARAVQTGSPEEDLKRTLDMFTQESEPWPPEGKGALPVDRESPLYQDEVWEEGEVPAQ